MSKDADGSFAEGTAAQGGAGGLREQPPAQERTPDSLRRAREDARRPWVQGPGGEGWLALGDDDLLFRVQSLGPEHGCDDDLLAVVRSDRHFFVRQEAAKRIRHAELLKAHAEDRHVGQVLVRSLTRQEDVVYLQALVRESRYLEVRKAAEAQLRTIASGQPR